MLGGLGDASSDVTTMMATTLLLLLLLLLLFLSTRQLTAGTAYAIRLQAITTMLLIPPTLQNHHHQCGAEFHTRSAPLRSSKAPRSSSSKSSIFASERCGLLWHFPPFFLKCDYPYLRRTLTCFFFICRGARAAVF
jgi:hypothetical protein